MVVALILKLIGRGHGVVAVVQCLVLVGNATFWVVLSLEVLGGFP